MFQKILSLNQLQAAIRSMVTTTKSGDGRGHAARVRAMVEHLRDHHDLTLFAPGDAFSFLAPLYAGSEVKVEQLSGLRFHYNSNDQVNYPRTMQEAAKYLWQLPGLIKALRTRMQKDPPALVITDFEPALPRAARSLGIPFVSLNHQHFVLTYDLRSLPPWLRWHTIYISLVVRSYYSGQAETIVSSFYFPPMRRNYPRVTQIGVLLRPEFEDLQSADAGYVLVYCRRSASSNLLEALRSLTIPVRIYGLGERPSSGNLRFCPIDQFRFLEDLAGCTALITTAGNQLVGEALYLRKPVLALPEANNYEQFINAHFLRQSACGDWTELEKVDVSTLTSFLARLDTFRRHMDPARMNGVPKALNIIRRCLPAGRQNVPAAKTRPAHA